MNLSDYYTKNQCDNLFISKFDSEAIQTHLTVLDQIVLNQNNSITSLNTNLYDPLLYTGDTKINNLTGLSNFVNTKISSNTYVTSLGQLSLKHENEIYNPLKNDGGGYQNQITLLSGLTRLISDMNTSSVIDLTNFSLDPFMGVINLNTNLSTTQMLSFNNMPQNSINYNTALSSYKSLRFGKIEMHSMPSSDTSLNVQDWIQRSQRYYNFYLNLEDLKTLNAPSLGIPIFVPDRIFNIYDKRTYHLHTIYCDESSQNFNNLNLGLMHLYFRNHVKFWYETIQQAFGIGTGRFAELRLYLAFLNPIHLYGYANILNPNTKVRVTFCAVSNSFHFKALGLYHLLYIPLLRNQAPIYNFSKLHVVDGTTKFINEIKFPDSSILTFGGYLASTWTEYSSDYATYTTSTSTPTYFAESDEVSTFYDYLNKLAIM